MNTRIKKLIIALCVASTAVPAAFAGTGLHIPNEEVTNDAGYRMDQYLSRLQDLGFHGSVLVAQKGSILLHKAYGLADVTTGDTNSTNTGFSTGSVTKQFTATAILKLEMAGKLSVHDPISKYLDGVPEDKQEITIHHLLTHSAGIRGMYGQDSEEITRDSMMKRILATPLENPVGARYEYSNGGYSMLAAIVEIVSGVQYEQYLRDELFAPSGMNNTGLHLVDFSEGGIAKSHNAEEGYPSPADRTQNCWNILGNGGILSTPADMYRWYLALQGDRLLSAEAKEKMFTPHIREYEDGPETYYGYGWVVQQSSRRDSKVIWHNGGAMPPGWSCAVYNYVDDSTVYIVFANKPMGGEHPVDAIVMSLTSALFDDEFELPPAKAHVSDASLAQLAGLYTIEGVGDIRISAREGSLHVMPVGQQAVTALYPSRMARMLPKYNDMSQTMVAALSEGRFQDAADMFDFPPDMNGAEVLKDFWSSFDSLGVYQRFDVHGTRMGDGAETSGTMHFGKGARDIHLSWMNGMCQGMGEGGRMEREFVPSSEREFASFRLMEGTATMLFSVDGRDCTLDLGEGEIQARRAN